MSKKSHKALASATVMSLILTSTLTAVPVSAAATVERLEGAGREETAISVAKKAFADGAETVVLVNGYGYGDAVSATPLAKALNAPILLTNKVDVPSADLLNALSSLKAKKIVIVGGEGVVTTALANKLAETYTVDRIGGASRYETNAGVAKKVLELTGKKEAFLVNGQDGYADALSVASIAATKGAPVLFGNKNEVPSVVKNVAEGLTVSAVGGAGVLPTSVVDSVKGTRVAEGKDRFATNLEVLKKFKDDLKLDSIYMAFGGATPTQFADALVASAAAAKVGAPVVLSGSKNSDASTSAAKDYIKGNHKDNTKIYLVGGTGSLDSAIESSIKDMVNPTVTEFKLESVKADNLHEVEVKFSRPVDKITANDEGNYSISGLDKKFKTAKVLDDGMTVRLAFDKGDTNRFTNQKEYKLSFNNIKEADGTRVLKVEDYKFTPVDSTLPYVEKVEALGNKTVKVTFNEPILNAYTSNFEIDGNGVSGGYVDITGDGRSVILKLYSTLSNGEHKINIKGVEDYSGLKSIGKDMNFTVVEDTVAPTVASIESATFEKVVIRFSEVVDPSTVLGSNVYWMQGTSKKYAKADPKQISDDTFEFEFTGDNVLRYATDLYISGVKDYSSNEIAKDTKVQVIPTVDQSRPEVVNVEVKDDRQNIVVKFNKSLDEKSVKESKNYVIKDKDGKEVNKYKVAKLAGSDNKQVEIALGSKLDGGKEYTIEISGVSDNTTLKNVMLPYNKKLVIEDKDAPKAVRVETMKDSKTIVVYFDKVMTIGGEDGIGNKSKYHLRTTKDGAKWIELPEETRINVTSDAKAAMIVLPKDTKFDFDQITDIRVQLVRDSNNNYIEGLSKDFVINSELEAIGPEAKTAKAVEKNKVEVKFDKAILNNTVDRGDFKVVAVDSEGKTTSTLEIVNAELKSNDDDDVVVLTLADSYKLNEAGKYGDIGSDKAVKVTIKEKARTASPAGTPIKNNEAGITVVDGIKATVDEITKGTARQIKVTFNERLGALDSQAATDIVLKNSKGQKLDENDFTLELDTNTQVLLINVKADSTKATEIMKIKINPRFIKDEAGNAVAEYDEAEILMDLE